MTWKKIKKPFFKISLILFIPMSLVMRFLFNDGITTWGVIFFLGAFFSSMVAVFLIALREFATSEPIENDSQSKIKANKISASSHFLSRGKNEDEQEYVFPEFKSFTARFLAKYFPFALIYMQKMFGKIDTKPAENIHKVLSKSQRIDIIPSKHGTRAFTILIDQKTALYFSQDGDKFVYDGWDAGKYEDKGKVTIFDDLKG